MNRGAWFGIDISNEVSLMDYGMLMRRMGKMYQVVVKYPEENKFVYGWFDDRQLIEDLESDSDFPTWKDLAEYSGITTEGYREQILGNERDNRAVILLDDMISTYSVEDAVSIDPFAKVYTENQIRKKLNRGLTNK